MKKIVTIAALACSALLSQANATVIYDADVTNNAIFGDGNANGAYTVFRDNGIELGLRGKLRHNSSGDPENTFNSNGDGTYSFDAGVALGQSSPIAAVWSFEWSINTDYDGSTNTNLDDYTYEMLIDIDPSLGQSFLAFDLMDPAASPTGFWDHAIGDNNTGAGDGVSANNATEYGQLISDNNLAQNSWKPHWFNTSLDPTVDGVYSFSLAIRDAQGLFLGSTDIDIIVGEGAQEVSSPAVLSIFGLGLLALVTRRKKQSK